MGLVSATLLWPFRQQSRRGRPVLNSGEVAALSKDAQGVASPAIPEGIGGEADEGPDRHGAVLKCGPATVTCSLLPAADALQAERGRWQGVDLHLSSENPTRSERLCSYGAQDR